MADLDQRADSFSIPEEIVVDLKKPIKKAAANGEVLTRLSFRPPTVGEMKQVAARAKRDDVEGTIFMLSLLNVDGLTPPEIERMNFIDMQICQEKLAPFLSLNASSAAPKD